MHIWTYLLKQFKTVFFKKIGFKSPPQPFRKRLIIESLEGRITPARFSWNFTPDLVEAREIPIASLWTSPSPNHDKTYSNIIILDQDLVDQVPTEELAGSQVVVINHQENPITQIDKAFAVLSDIESVRIISHGLDGGLALGGFIFDETTIESSRKQIADWGKALAPDADILLYGCSIASTDKGKHFVDLLSEATGHDVAASINNTGAGGDLFLEYQSGLISHSLIASQSAWNDSGLSLPEEQNFIYIVNGSTVTITGYTGSDSSIIIPDTLGDKPVTSIGANAFFNKIDIVNVSMGENITKIERKAFYNCIALESVTFGKSNTYVSDSAFYNCISLATVKMSQNITAIEANAFYNCFGLQSFTISSNISKIANKTFYNCMGLETLYFLGNAPAIGTDVFKGVTASTTVYHFGNTTGWNRTFGGLSTAVLQETISTVQSSTNSSVYGDQITFSAKVSAALGIPDGTVRFFADANLIGTADLSDGQATISADLLNAGSRVITVEYGTNGGYWTSTSSQFTQVITKAPQNISWTAPQSISLGTAIGTSQLNGSVAGITGGSDPGSLSYDVPLGTVLSRGSHNITVTASETDNYLETTKTIKLWVNDHYPDPNPSPGNGFGTVVLSLTNGNVVITAPYDDAGGTNAGAVYLYNGSTGALISALKGSNTGDQIGSDGVTALTNGNFVVQSSNFDGGKGAVTFANGSTGLTTSVTSLNSLVGGSTTDHMGLANYPIFALKNGGYVVRNPLWNGGMGAVTWGSGSTGVSGVVSSTNSLVGSNTLDSVGNKTITELANGNFVVRSSLWNSAAGAVTWGSKITGVTGVVGAANSLIGSSANDQVGTNSIANLTNGNFVVTTPTWNNGGNISAAGAATWMSGTTGKTNEGAFGAITPANSIVGTTIGDSVGLGGVTVLTGNNKFVVISPNWSGNAGAATWANGSDGSIVGVVSSSNSLVGEPGAQVGSGGVTALGNGNYVVNSVNWGSNKGAVTLGDGAVGTSGIVAVANSLVGTTTGSYVGSSGVTELSNGNFVVKSALWNSGSAAAAGAVTFSSGTSGVTGSVSNNNSIVGSTANDKVGTSVTALNNGNYVVVTPTWSNSLGAVTWGNGTSGTSGTVSDSNSFVGSTANDRVGSGGITVLSNNNYVVYSPNWSNGGSALAAGAVTFGNGFSATTGTVGSTNSLVGSHTNDNVGIGGVTALANGTYAVVSPVWNSDSAASVGAVTFGSSSGVTGTVSSSNSIVGSNANDQVGSGGVTLLNNGNYVVASPLWSGKKGAATWANGSSGTTGTVSSSNSLVGSENGDMVASGGIIALKGNSNYVVLSPQWSSGKGAATWGNGLTTAGGVKGAISSANSLVGSTNGDGVGSGGVTTFTGGNYLVSSASWNNGGSKANAGAVTYGSGTSGIAGVVSSTNSIVGNSANAGLAAISENDQAGTYVVKFLTEPDGLRIAYGFQNNKAPTITSIDQVAFTVGAAETFTLTAMGGPVPSISLVQGNLPLGIRFDYTTGILSGTAATGTKGVYLLTFRASNGSGNATDQVLTLTIS